MTAFQTRETIHLSAGPTLLLLIEFLPENRVWAKTLDLREISIGLSWGFSLVISVILTEICVIIGDPWIKSKILDLTEETLVVQADHQMEHVAPNFHKLPKETELNPNMVVLVTRGASSRPIIFSRIEVGIKNGWTSIAGAFLREMRVC